MQGEKKTSKKRKLKQFRLLMITATMIFEHKFLEDKDGTETYAADPLGRGHAAGLILYSGALVQSLDYVWNLLIIC